MLAVIKTYTFPGRPGAAADTVMMTSYPGLLASTDDFYLARGAAGSNHSMVIMETTMAITDIKTDMVAITVMDTKTTITKFF